MLGFGLQRLHLRGDARGEGLHDLLEAVALALDRREYAAHVHRRARRLPRGTWMRVKVRVSVIGLGVRVIGLGVRVIGLGLGFDVSPAAPLLCAARLRPASSSWMVASPAAKRATSSAISPGDNLAARFTWLGLGLGLG